MMTNFPPAPFDSAMIRADLVALIPIIMRAGPKPYFDCVSVVVVVVGPGVVVCCDVVVVLWVVSEAHPEMSAKKTTAKQERMIFFIRGLLVYWLINNPL